MQTESFQSRQHLRIDFLSQRARKSFLLLESHKAISRGGEGEGEGKGCILCEEDCVFYFSSLTFYYENIQAYQKAQITVQ